MRAKWMLAALLLSGCATKVISVPVEIPPPAVVVPKVTPMNLTDVKWHLYNRESLEALVAELEKNPDRDFVIFALDAQNYEALSLNMNEIKRFLREQKEVTEFLMRVLELRSQHNEVPPTDD